MANEKRLIDANALSDEVAKSKHNNPHPQGMIRVNHRNEHDHFFANGCGICQHEVFSADDCTVDPVTEPDDFCSYGERREGE